MEVRREHSKIVNRTKYNEMKNNLYINRDAYTRECCFVREIIFGDGGKAEERVTFSLWLNRNNYNQIQLSEKYYSNGIVNYAETRLTRLQAMHVIYGDLSYMESSDNFIIQQLSMYMKYNQFQAVSFKEYFEENYYNIYNTDILNIKSMELDIQNNITEFFSEQLKPVKDIDYNQIKINVIQEIEVPAMIYIG